MSQFGDDYWEDDEWVEPEKDLCDYFEGECVANHDCINCWIMTEVNKEIFRRLEQEKEERAFLDGKEM